MLLPLIRAEKLSKTFTVGKRSLTALKPTSFSIYPGQTLGIVGESGCGKSTLGRTLLRLYEPSAGKIFFHGQDLTKLSLSQMKPMRRHLQMIFQDPFSSLNPRMTVRDIIGEPLVIHEPGQNHQKRIQELLDLVNLPQNAAGRFPHEFSGGQRQRIGIARALALSPEFIVCDEPISALDVSIQAQIANLLLKLQKELNLTYLFIAHDLSMVKVLASRIAVMYHGEFVETGPAEELFSNPRHPYTKMLIASIPLHNPAEEKKRTQVFLKGEPPSPFDPPKGCAFSSRCPMAKAICFQQKPELRENAPGHHSACFLNAPSTIAEKPAASYKS